MKFNPQNSASTSKVDKPKGKSILEREINLFPQHISDKEKELIYRQLAVLQQSGVDFRSSFEILFDQLKKKKTKEKLQQVLVEIIKGKSLSDAMLTLADFSPYEVYTIRIGEETGKLTMVLQKLSGYFANKMAQRRQVVSAFSYPLLIMLTSLGAVSFMIFFIIPMFEEVFQRFGSDLPALTKSVIAFANGFKVGFPYVMLLLAGLLVTHYLVRNNRKYIYYQESIWMRLPLVGQIYKDIYLARFSDTMGLLIQSAVPMVNTLDMVKKMIGFRHIEIVLNDITTDLVQGKSITDAFRQHDIFDKQMVALIKVGEEVNKLGGFFEQLSVDYTESVKHKTSLLATFLEPLMIVFLGLVVGLILIAMYLPMFELSSSMNFGN